MPVVCGTTDRASRLGATVWAAFAALALGQLLVDIDDVVLNIALPSIAADVRLSASERPWTVNAYVLCFGGLLLLGGRLADRYGHRAVLSVGIVVFAVTSGAGSLAASAGQVIGARAGQGLAAALIAPAAMSLLVHTFREPETRGRALGIWGAVTGAGTVLGLVVGGLVTEHVGWRWIFTGNAAAALVVGASVLALLPGGTGDRRIRIEPLGALSATVGLVCAVQALNGTLEHGWLSTHTAGFSVAALALLALAAGAWRHGDAPLVPLTLLRDRAVMVSNGCAMLTGAGLLGTFYFVSLHLQEVLGYTPMQVAGAYLPLVVGLVFAAGVASPLVPRLGARPILVTGMLACALGLGTLGGLGMTAHRESFWASLLPGLLVCGLGLGLAFVSLTVTAIPGGEQTSDGGAASGLYNTALQVGGAIGIAVLATVASSRAGSVLGQGGSPAEALASGRALALFVASALLLCGVALARALPPHAGCSGDTGPHGTRSA